MQWISLLAAALCVTGGTITVITVIAKRTRTNKSFFVLGIVIAMIGFGLHFYGSYNSVEARNVRDANFEKNAATLSAYFCMPGISHDLAWWLNIPPPERMQAAMIFWPYREVLNKRITPKYQEGERWEVYYQEQVFPRLFDQYSVTWCPPDPRHQVQEQSALAITGVTINGQAPESPAPNVYIVPAAKPQ